MIANVVSFQVVLTVIGALFVLAPDGQAISAGENRKLASMPEFTWNELYDGKYTRGIEAYVADHFPQRDKFMELAGWLKSLRGLSVESGMHYAVNINEGLVDEDSTDDDLPEDGLSESLMWDTDRFPPSQLSRENASTRFAGQQAPPGDSNDSQAKSASTKSPGKARLRAGVFVYNGRAMQGFGGRATGSNAYASAINAYENEIGPKVDIYSLIVPTAQEFYLPSTHRRKSNREKANISGTYKQLDAGIKTVDAYSEIAAHTNEYLYFRTDHHWTALGGYYAYRAFCNAAKISPVPLSKMAKHTLKSTYFGTLYRLTQDRSLKKSGDKIEYFVPPTTTTMTKYLEDGKGRGWVRPLFRHKSSGYGVFLGGDAAMLRLTTSVKNGKRAIVVKNSYGNAFVVYLVSHYEELVFLDYRLFKGRLSDVINENERDTDLIFINGVHTSNARSHVKRIRRLLYRGRRLLRNKKESGANEKVPE